MFDPWVGEDPLEKGMATHFSILVWRILWTIQSMGSQESDTTERLSLSLGKSWTMQCKSQHYAGNMGNLLDAE